MFSSSNAAASKSSFKQSMPSSEDEIDYDSLTKSSIHVPTLSSFEGISEDSPYVRGTTLLKSLDHSGIDKDEAEEINNHIESFKKQHRLFDKFYEEFKLTGVDRGKGSVRVGPVLRVTSVIISNRSGSPWSEFKIHGEISVTDYQHNTFYFYRRESVDAEAVSSECSRLSLNGWLMAPVMRGIVRFRLKFTNDSGVKFFEGNYDVDYTIEDAFGKESTIECFNEDGYCATMVFHKIPFAILVEFETFLKRSRQETPGQADNFTVHGTIRANKILCFEKKSEDAMEMVHGKCKQLVSLFGEYYAVPTQSLLRFEILLRSGDVEVADDTLELDPREVKPYRWKFPCKNKCFDFTIDVTDWLAPDFFFDPVDPRWMEDVNVEWSPDVSRLRQPPPASDHPFVEVYSIFFGGGDLLLAPALCGTIVARNEEKPDYIFARTNEFPDDLSNVQFRTLSLSWPDRWVLEKDFLMHLKLKDVQNNEVCRGIFKCEEWHAAIAQYCCDRRLCAFIGGVNGYFAAVHYSIFRNALRAKITVECEGGPLLVYGSVVAEYDNYDYSSTYDKEYYRNIIFKRSVEECVKVQKGCEIPLSKSHVSAPYDCTKLIVDVNLVVCPSLVSVARCSIGRISLEAGINKRQRCGDITVNVEWAPKSGV